MGCRDSMPMVHTNCHILDEAAVGKIAEANELLRQEGLFDLLEFKPGATAVHWRGMDAAATEVARKVEKVWSRLHSHQGIELLKFDGGMEIRVAGRNKGDAVRTILAEMGGQSAIAYLGDDHTDEDAFEALHGYGLSVLVRDEYRPTVADVVDPAARGSRRVPCRLGQRVWRCVMTTPKDRMVVVSNRLPVTIEQKPGWTYESSPVPGAWLQHSGLYSTIVPASGLAGPAPMHRQRSSAFWRSIPGRAISHSSRSS